MQVPIDQLKIMAEAVVREGFGPYQIMIGITSIGWNPGGRLQAVFEGEHEGHLVQVEIYQNDHDQLVGHLIKPSSPVGFRLIFSPLQTWTYVKAYR